MKENNTRQKKKAVVSNSRKSASGKEKWEGKNIRISRDVEGNAREPDLASTISHS
jgi:hypothetical protein